MSATSEIVHLDPKARFASEHNSLVNSLSYLDWTLQVQTIVQALSLPLSEILENPDTPIPPGSLAHRLGHKTVHSFICDSGDNYGLARNWDTWSNQVVAFRHKHVYGIYAETPTEVISEFNDVSKVLGHIPASSAEYHKAKDDVLIQQRKDVEQHHQMVVSEMKERISDLIQNADADQKRLAQEQARSESLSNELRTAINEADQRLEVARQQHETELEEALTGQKAELEALLAQQMENIQRDAQMQVSEANERIAQLKRTYSEENYVSRSEYTVLSQELDRERQTNREYLMRVNELNDSLEKSLEAIRTKDSLISSHEARLREQEVMIDELRSQIESVGTAEGVVNSDELNQLNARIDMLESYIGRYRDQNRHLKDQQGTLAKQLQRMAAKLAKAETRLRKKNKAIKLRNNALKHNRTTIHALGGLLVLMGAATVLLITAL